MNRSKKASTEPDADGERKAVGRMLRTFRLVNSLSIEDAAVAAFLTVDQLMAIEAGQRKVGFGEADDLKDAYELCASCFSKFFAAAKRRGGVWAQVPTDPQLHPDDRLPEVGEASSDQQGLAGSPDRRRPALTGG